MCSADRCRKESKIFRASGDASALPLLGATTAVTIFQRTIPWGKRPQTSPDVLRGGVSASQCPVRYSLASKIHYFRPDNEVHKPNRFMPSAETGGQMTTKTPTIRVASHGVFMGSETHGLL